MQLKAALNEAASGLVPEIDLIDQPSIRNAMNEFESKSHSNRLYICAIYHEKWFQDNTIIMNNIQYYCNRCLKDDKSNHTPDIPLVHSFGDLNDIIPFYHRNPLAISELKPMEELYPLTPVEHSLIARHTLVSQTYRLKGPRHGQNYSCSGNVANLSIYISPICDLVPRILSESGIFVVRCRRGIEPDQCKDFKVRRNHILQWLLFLKKWNPAYNDIIISNDNLAII
jgi:hypothetical protein